MVRFARLSGDRAAQAEFYEGPHVYSGRHFASVTPRSLKRISRKHFLFLRVGIVMVVTAMLMNIALTTFYNELLQAFLWNCMGLGVRSAKNDWLAVDAVMCELFSRP